MEEQDDQFYFNIVVATKNAAFSLVHLFLKVAKSQNIVVLSKKDVKSLLINFFFEFVCVSTKA